MPVLTHTHDKRKIEYEYDYIVLIVKVLIPSYWRPCKHGMSVYFGRTVRNSNQDPNVCVDVQSNVNKVMS